MNRLIEERELVQRIPDYAAYRQQVPARAARLWDMVRLWRLLLTGRE